MIAKLRNNLALSLMLRGDLAEAEGLLLQSVQAYEQSCGTAHPDSWKALNNLSQVYREVGRQAEAEPSCDAPSIS